MATKPIPGGANYEKRDPVPAGLHVARCFALYEIGTVEDSWKGQVKHLFKINVGFELPNLLLDFTEKQIDGSEVTVKKPAMVSQMFTLSAAPSSKLREFMESWRAAKYKDGEFEQVDLSKMLGAPCMLNIMHNAKDDTVYANINGVMPVMQGIQVPPQFNPSKYLSYDNFDVNLFQSLPKFLREMIEKTPEYRKVNGGFAQAQPQPQGFANAAPQQIAQGIPQQQFASNGFGQTQQVPQGWVPAAGQAVGQKPASDIPQDNSGLPF